MGEITCSMKAGDSMYVVGGGTKQRHMSCKLRVK
jgi:hypothetical protein